MILLKFKNDKHLITKYLFLMNPAMGQEDCHAASFRNINSIFTMFCYWPLISLL